MMLWLMSKDERMVAEHLPCEPNGLSAAELAEGLLEDFSPPARSRIQAALGGLALLLGGLAVRRGQDELGNADARLYGLPRDAYTVVRRLFAAEAESRERAWRSGEPAIHDERFVEQLSGPG